MNTAAFYHRSESEFAYLYTKDQLHLRIRTARSDVEEVFLIAGDPYQLETQRWFEKKLPLKKWLSTSEHDFWQIEVTAPFKRLSYAFLICQQNEMLLYNDQGIFPVTEDFLTKGNAYFRLPYFHEIDRFNAPEWVKKVVWYQIFPERFANGDKTNDPAETLPWGSKEHPGRTDFYGGDLQGVMDHLDYLTDLGVNGLYFCPLFTAPSNHKYDTVDYFEIDPAFGDKALFKKLVAACHERGIYVMLDAVFNHIGDTSPQWQDVIKNGADSAYKDWFHIESFPVSYQATSDFEVAEKINYDTFAFTPHMPKLNTANPEVQAYILRIAQYWIEEFDIDAWRLDVANEVDHHFWKKFHESCLALKPDFYILGEIWHSAQSWLQGDEFSGVMNYAFTESILAFFLEKKITMAQMISNLNRQLTNYRSQANQMMVNNLDSHDTPRLLTLAQDDTDLMKQVLAFTYLQQGLPCLYYGDEVGMTGEMDPDCRKCMVWAEEKQDLALLDFVKKLIALRHQNVELLSEGELIWLTEEPAKEKLSFLRQNIAKNLMAVFNTGEAAISHELQGEILLDNGCEITGESAMIAPKGFVITLK